MGVFSIFKKFFSKQEQEKNRPQSSDSVFAARFHRFKLFLNAHLDVSAEVLELEERLSDPMPYGMPFIRTSAAKLSTATMQCIVHLNALAGGRYKKIQEPFDALRAEVQKLLGQAVLRVEGPMLLRLDEITEEHARTDNPLVTPDMVRLAALSRVHPEYVPQGFVLTGAAWMSFMAYNDLQAEIDRTIQISRDDPDLYEAACSAIRDRMLEAALPPEVEEALMQGLDGVYESLSSADQALLVHSRPVLHAHSALLLPEQLIAYTPDLETAREYCRNAFKKAMSLAFRPQSFIHRLKLGIRHRAMPFCVVFMRISAESARGDLSMRLDLSSDILPGVGADITQAGVRPPGAPEISGQGSVPDSDQAPVEACCIGDLAGSGAKSSPRQLSLHVRRGFTELADEERARPKLESTDITPELREKLLEAGCKASVILSGECNAFWALSRRGEVSFLSFPECLSKGSTASSIVPNLPDGLLSGRGWPFDPGKLIGCANGCDNVRGRAFLVRNLTDAIAFPLGGVLVMERAAQQWSFLLEFASAAVVGKAAESGYFAATARLLQKPLFICGTTGGNGGNGSSGTTSPGTDSSGQDSAGQDSSGASSAVSGEADGPEALLTLVELPHVYIDFTENKICELILTPEEKEEAIEYLMAPQSPINGLGLRLAALSLPRHLPLNPENPSFVPDSCKSFIDIALYARAKGMLEMFRYGTERKTARSSAKQLTTHVPKQFWVVDLDDGFKEAIEGQYVNIHQVASKPMCALWEGMEAVPWEGPPPVDAKGFISVLFEATANPSLDPAQQSSVYTEKNYFMLTREYCSMRSRFGFHYLSLDALVGKRAKDNFVIFQFRGGAANRDRRILRVNFVSELLRAFGFHTDITGDTMTARIEGGSEELLLPKMRVVGYLVMHTRQLDMIMNDTAALAERRVRMMAHMTALERGEDPVGVPAVN